MRKRASAIAFLAWGGVLLIALVLASCSNSPVTHTVSFDPQNGDEIFTITVQDGMAADKPEDPERDGYIFQGWHTDPNNHADETVYDFSSPVASDITLYAGWEEEYTPPPTYTVSFNANGGTEIPDQRVTSGSTAEKPADPIRGGYSFAGWYSDEGLQTEYLFTEPMASSITLHAKWIALYTVTFTYDSSKYSNSNITMPSDSTMTKEEGTALSALKPDDPVYAAGNKIYVFTGWYENGAEKPFAFEGNLDRDLTLYAEWSESYIENGTYYVHDAEGLLAWSVAAESNTRLNCNILEDITMPEGHEWPQIGVYSSDFTGTIDANGHTVSGLAVNNDCAGFVGYLGRGGVIKDLILKDASITSSYSRNSYAGGFAGQSYGTIIGCSFIGGSVSAASGGDEPVSYAYAGGIVGSNIKYSSMDTHGKILGCYVSDAKISAAAEGIIDGSSYSGGIVGCNEFENDNTDYSVIACYSINTQLSAETGNGYIAGENNGNITACYFNETGLGIGSGTKLTGATKVEGSVTWETAMNDMNTELEKQNAEFRFADNNTEAKDSIPLIIEKATLP